MFFFAALPCLLSHQWNTNYHPRYNTNFVIVLFKTLVLGQKHVSTLSPNLWLRYSRDHSFVLSLLQFRRQKWPMKSVFEIEPEACLCHHSINLPVHIVDLLGLGSWDLVRTSNFGSETLMRRICALRCKNSILPLTTVQQLTVKDLCQSTFEFVCPKKKTSSYT